MVLSIPLPETLAAVTDTLSAGGVTILPCDTIYGFVGVAPETEGRIRAIKGRGEDKPFLQLLPNLDWLSRLTRQEIPTRFAARWPGPLTLVVQARSGGTVAVRLPDSAFLRSVLAAVGKPLYSTSVNLAGSPPLHAIEEIIRQFESRVDLVVDAGVLPSAAASTIVDVTSRPYRILRQGALRIPDEDLEAGPAG
ncbi:MAG TPA: L-threonylcarbamoyladenylate synthase [Spirochaetia bacterium]|nr:L-threonylcarbamoyladenylate synthase [Spirochaetia bacterium]